MGSGITKHVHYQNNQPIESYKEPPDRRLSLLMRESPFKTYFKAIREKQDAIRKWQTDPDVNKSSREIQRLEVEVKEIRHKVEEELTYKITTEYPDLSPESVQTLIMRCEMPDNENLEERRNSVDSVDSLTSANVTDLKEDIMNVLKKNAEALRDVLPDLLAKHGITSENDSVDEREVEEAFSEEESSILNDEEQQDDDDDNEEEEEEGEEKEKEEKEEKGKEKEEEEEENDDVFADDSQKAGVLIQTLVTRGNVLCENELNSLIDNYISNTRRLQVKRILKEQERMKTEQEDDGSRAEWVVNPQSEDHELYKVSSGDESSTDRQSDNLHPTLPAVEMDIHEKDQKMLKSISIGQDSEDVQTSLEEHVADTKPLREQNTQTQHELDQKLEQSTVEKDPETGEKLADLEEELKTGLRKHSKEPDEEALREALRTFHRQQQQVLLCRFIERDEIRRKLEVKLNQRGKKQELQCVDESLQTEPKAKANDMSENQVEKIMLQCKQEQDTIVRQRRTEKAVLEEKRNKKLQGRLQLKRMKMVEEDEEFLKKVEELGGRNMNLEDPQISARFGAIFDECMSQKNREKRRREKRKKEVEQRRQNNRPTSEDVKKVIIERKINDARTGGIRVMERDDFDKRLKERLRQRKEKKKENDIETVKLNT